MLILLKKEKIVSCVITICIIIGLFLFANVKIPEMNTIQASSNVIDNNVSSSISTNSVENINE